MEAFSRRAFVGCSITAGLATLFGNSLAVAQFPPGVETTVAAVITGEERGRQPELWALETHYKPMRMIEVDLEDPETGKTRRETLWYMAYRVVNRKPDAKSNASKKKAADRPLFVPQVLMIAEKDGVQTVYEDRVIPVAQAAINKRERFEYRNSVEIVGHLPKPASETDTRPESLNGVAIFRNVDPKTVRFSVVMIGFSNGYDVKVDADGKELVQRKAIQQKFWRPADRFDQYEGEIRMDEAATWLYR